MDSKAITDVVKKLVGAVSPIGSSSVDNVRFKNLEILTEVAEDLLDVIQHIAKQNKEAQEHSVKKAGEFADEFINRIKQEL